MLLLLNTFYTCEKGRPELRGEEEMQVKGSEETHLLNGNQLETDDGCSIFLRILGHSGRRRLGTDPHSLHEHTCWIDTGSHLKHSQVNMNTFPIMLCSCWIFAGISQLHVLQRGWCNLERITRKNGLVGLVGNCQFIIFGFKHSS